MPLMGMLWTCFGGLVVDISNTVLCCWGATRRLDLCHVSEVTRLCYFYSITVGS